MGDRCAFILDGTTIPLSPTPELKKAFPPASHQHGESVWPIALLVVAQELESGCAMRPEVGSRYGPEATSEVALTKPILPKLPTNSVLLADRDFGVFAIAWGARQAGHELVSRLTQPRFKKPLQRDVSAPDPVGPPGTSRWQVAWEPSRDDRRSHPELPAEASIHMWL